MGQKIQRELRKQAEAEIATTSSLPLVLIRSALPELDAKRASKPS
jgi:hypothetical protein